MLTALNGAAEAARAISRQGQSRSVAVATAGNSAALYPATDPTTSITDEQKKALVSRIDAETRKLDSRIEQVIVSLSSNQDLVLIAAADGTLAADVRPLVRLNVTVIVEENGRREQGYCGGGARADLGYFLEDDRPMEYAREAVRQAVVLLDAEPAPAGAMPVVLGAGWPGILLHEAVGHGLEGDFNRKGTSAFSGRVGQQVASPLCTIVDDGTIAKPARAPWLSTMKVRRASTTCWSRSGILRGYMQDKMNARLMGVAADRKRPARVIRPRADAAHDQHVHAGGSRMIRTRSFASVDKGLYAPNFGGGQVDITSGKFVFLGQRGLPD